MKTTIKPANRFRRPVSAIISCMGPLLLAGPLVSCGTGPLGMTASKPLALRSEYQLKSWRDYSRHSGDETLSISGNPLTNHDFIPIGGVINDALLAEVMNTMTGEPSRASIRKSDDAIEPYIDVAKAIEFSTPFLLDQDESPELSGKGTPAEGFWNEQASR